MDKEIWKDIEGYDGLYQVSNMGRVRSLNNGKEKILKPQKVPNGYFRVFLYKQNGRWLSIHRIVANTFLPNPENKLQVNHINGIKTDNRVKNLEWVTPSQNMKHALDNGLQAQGEDNYLAKLTNEQAIAIQNEYIKYSKMHNQKALAKKYGVNRCVIRDIVSGKHYKNTK